MVASRFHPYIGTSWKSVILLLCFPERPPYPTSSPLFLALFIVLFPRTNPKNVRLWHQFAGVEPRRSDSFATKRNLVEILRFTLFSRHVVFDGEGDKLRNKRIENHITVSVVIDMECGNTKN